eukprot:1137196-Pelagomonas_calceolata.AAC.1
MAPHPPELMHAQGLMPIRARALTTKTNALRYTCSSLLHACMEQAAASVSANRSMQHTTRMQDTHGVLPGHRLLRAGLLLGHLQAGGRGEAPGSERWKRESRQKARAHADEQIASHLG